MAETLLAIVLVTSSANGTSLICRWPPSPQASPRLARPRPSVSYDPDQYDNPWRSANVKDGVLDDDDACMPRVPQRAHDEWEYIWQRPRAARDRSHSFSRSASHSTHSGRASPIKDSGAGGGSGVGVGGADAPLQDEYGALLGYSAEFFAGLLLPKRALCHQKFALAVDDLFFVGHPVCADADGTWQFKREKDVRGRGACKRRVSVDDISSSTEFDSPPQENNGSLPPPPPPTSSSWLETFHVAFVHEVPDPSSPASGNIGKYFDVIYEQVSFTLTAVLFQEQVLSNFVEKECDVLTALKDDFASKFRTYEEYMEEALTVSSVAPAMKTLYESIKSRSLAHLTIHSIPLELQLPPYLDSLLHSTDAECFAEHDEVDSQGGFADGAVALASRGWMDVYAAIRGTNVREEDKLLAEQLIKFLETVDVTLSLVDVASLLDWDLETQVYPIVRWLVHHRRAKIVDMVHRCLKTVFALPIKIEASLKDLAEEFRQAFPDPSIPQLPQLLATISGASSNHFYATVAKSKDRVPMFHEVVRWLLQRDLLVTLHLRVRIVVPAQLKARVRRRREELREHSGANIGEVIEPPILEEGIELDEEIEDDEAEEAAEAEAARRREDGMEGDEDDDGETSILADPRRATSLQRRWLQAMSEGKDELVTRRFDQINQYFDGKCTDDEILFRAEISRRQLREVLHVYDEYVSICL
ncbi:nitrogen permease regulator of amino acid transport activity 3-domain-containing protein [Russula compacta]|nr:nitrogen permease regulator of amino acid transport activity 3-domain-containing protein [Russula compacta]